VFENIISHTDTRGWTYAKCEADDVWYTFHFEQYDAPRLGNDGRIAVERHATVYARIFTPQRIGRSMNQCHLVRAETLSPRVHLLTI